MATSELPERLSRMTTRWSLVREAHTSAGNQTGPARQVLAEQYGGAAYRYVLGAVRDPDVADELSQEFAVRLLGGDFHRACPERGRFRDYLKTVLVNLINDHFRTRGKWPHSLPVHAALPMESPESLLDGPSFEECLKEQFLDRTWSELERTQPRYHAVLLLRVEEPDLTSGEMAERLASSATGTRWTAASARKTLERARSRFAELLLNEVAGFLGADSAGDLQPELESLGLLRYCRSALERRDAE
jgi:RNA polymerase sigma-70 factor (ECF subfamily)